MIGEQVSEGSRVEPKKPGIQLETALAWLATLVASSLPLILSREIYGSEPYWLPWISSGILVAILLATNLVQSLRQIRSFIFILSLIFFLGFGGGWQWGLIPFVRSTSAWTSWASSVPWAISQIATHLLRFVPAIAVISFLSLKGRHRKDYFLAIGKIDAPVEPSKLLGMKKQEPWTKIGSIFALVFATGTLSFLMLSSPPSYGTFLEALPLIPVAVLIAGINSFNEEFTLRAAPLSELVGPLGKQQSLLITTLYFGLGHFYGIPNGLLGVALASFLGWFLGKSLLETKGFFWAWTIHFVQDVFIFSFLAMASL